MSCVRVCEFLIALLVRLFSPFYHSLVAFEAISSLVVLFD